MNDRARRVGIAWPPTFIIIATLLTPVPAFGQDASVPATRAEVIERQQQEKARTAAPYEQNRAERMLLQVEEGRFPFIGTMNGFYPAFGSVYSGGGLGFGGGFRHWVTNRSVFDVRGLFSVATFKRVQATYHAPLDTRGRVTFDTRVGWLDAPRIAFFGLGTDTPTDNRTVFGLKQKYGEGRITWKPITWVEVGGGAAYEAFNEEAGTGIVRSITERFTAEEAPNLGEDPTYAKLSGGAALLWLDTPAYTRHGGYLRATWDAYQRQDEPGSFGRTRTEIVQHVPILRETWVVSLRARRDAIVGNAADAPYFLVPSLGSGSTLRAYPTDRFRGNQTVLLSGEWRWIPSHLALDLAFFVDAGKAGSTWEDLKTRPWKKDYGIGVRFHSLALTALRIDVATGDEGLRVVFAASPPF